MAAAATDIRITLKPEELLRRLHEKKIKVLYKQGAYVTKTGQRSMRYAKPDKVSPAGKPPFAHKAGPDNPRGPLLRKLWRYEVNKSEFGVVSGPPLTTGQSPPVPKLLNEGGQIPRKRELKTNFVVGKAGPIRRTASGKLAGVKLTTANQVQRAERLALEENALRTLTVSGTIKPRPFIAPLFTDGGENFRKLVKTVPL